MIAAGKKFRPWSCGRAVSLLIALAIILVVTQTASACPSCKAALANQEGKGDLVSGFMYSILFMLSMPFAIFGSFSGYFYYLVRRARREQAAGVPHDQPQR